MPAEGMRPVSIIPAARRFTPLQSDALRWCRLAERGANTQVNGQVTDGTRFWGNYFGGPDASHPPAHRAADSNWGSDYRAAGPLTEGGVCPQAPEDGLWDEQDFAGAIQPVSPVFTAAGASRGQPNGWVRTADGPGNGRWIYPDRDAANNIPAGRWAGR